MFAQMSKSVFYKIVLTNCSIVCLIMSWQHGVTPSENSWWLEPKVRCNATLPEALFSSEGVTQGTCRQNSFHYMLGTKTFILIWSHSQSHPLVLANCRNINIQLNTLSSLTRHTLMSTSCCPNCLQFLLKIGLHSS